VFGSLSVVQSAGAPQQVPLQEGEEQPGTDESAQQQVVGSPSAVQYGNVVAGDVVGGDVVGGDVVGGDVVGGEVVGGAHTPLQSIIEQIVQYSGSPVE
jgi:hypothetical protein